MINQYNKYMESSATNKLIILFEPFIGGHHLMYLENYAKALIEIGFDVWVFVPQSMEFKRWVNATLTEHLDRINVFEPRKFRFRVTKQRKLKLFFAICLVFDNLYNTLSLWNNARKSIAGVSRNLKRSPYLVFFMWLDSYLSGFICHCLLDILFVYNWTGIYFHPRHLRIRNSINIGFFDIDNILKSRHCKTVAVLDSGVKQLLSAKIGKRVICFPDITDEIVGNEYWEPLEEIKKKSSGRTIIGLFGALSKRKAVLELLDVAIRLADKPFFFVFAGKVEKSAFKDDEFESIMARVKQSPENCFFYLDFIPDEEKYNSLIKLCDILYLVYLDFPHSSNMLTKAAIFEKNVIVNDGYCMSEMVRKYNLGLCIDAAKPNSIVDAIIQLSNSDFLCQNKSKTMFKEYAQLNSKDNLKNSLWELINIYSE